VKLAILLLIGGVGSWALNGLELIETKGDNGLVRGQQGADTARWAAVARVASLLNGDLLGSLVGTSRMDIISLYQLHFLIAPTLHGRHKISSSSWSDRRQRPERFDCGLGSSKPYLPMSRAK